MLINYYDHRIYTQRMDTKKNAAGYVARRCSTGHITRDGRAVRTLTCMISRATFSGSITFGRALPGSLTRTIGPANSAAMSAFPLKTAP